jgi:hypothetical protein
LGRSADTTGQALIGSRPEAGAQAETTTLGNEKFPSDFELVSLLARLVAGERGWLSYMRTPRQRADAILEAHWPAVKTLAIELWERGVVRGPDIADIIPRSM